MKRYEIEKMDGLYCVFENDRMISAFKNKKKAEEAVKRYKEKRKAGRK